MSNNVVSFKVDDQLYEYLQQKHNASAYLRELIKADMRGNEADLVGLQMQIETLEKQAQTHAEQEEMYQNRAEELRDLVEQSEQQKDITLQEAREKLSATPKEPTNPAIKEWSDRVGMSPEQLCEELQE